MSCDKILKWVEADPDNRRLELIYGGVACTCKQIKLVLLDYKQHNRMSVVKDVYGPEHLLFSAGIIAQHADHHLDDLNDVNFKRIDLKC